MFAAWISVGSPALESATYGLLTVRRQLDRGNAQEGSIADDFGRFGFNWWDSLRRADSRTTRRMRALGSLNRARNALAHDNPTELEALRREGYPADLETFRRSRRAVDGLATTMDQVFAGRLGSLFGRQAPW